MATSNRAFLVELYEEYLAEASFLYEQRLSLFTNPEISWMKIGEFEERLEAHIDGLVVGGPLAMEVCKRRVEKGDFGELHAAVRVFCRQNQKDQVFFSLMTTDLEDAERVGAATDALKFELPLSWHHDTRRLLETNPELAPLLIPALACKRADAVKKIPRILRSIPAKYAPDVIYAAGCYGDFSVQAEVSSFLNHSEPDIRRAAAVALLKLGDEQVMRQCLQQARTSAWPLIPLGLAGSRSAARNLLETVASHEADEDWAIGLGLLGDIASVPALLSSLSNPILASAAAKSLDLITGARITEKAFIPESLEEDELLEAEREKLRRGELPLRGDGKAFGKTSVRLSQKKENWAGWWTDNSSQFQTGVRYRHGKPYSLKSLLEILECPDTPYRLRQLAYEELAIRYAMDVPFEADMFVSDQTRALAQIDQWIQANNGRFAEGAWYFHGNLMYG